MKRMEHPCSAGFPACGFWGLSGPQFQAIVRNTELESSVNPQTGMSALRRWAIGAAPLPVFGTVAEACVDRIHRRVLTTTIHVLIIANEMVKRLDLPKLFASPLQYLVRLACC